ncbi:hypothetical protein GCM10025789_01840 [Tessaracoccus lubricantis]|uniref:Uncharacterized protein n=1 Tax=Tessaracoccus lubricantis TaxID=545543 RepID=A0ABP9EZA1_9ACTN
MTGVGGDDGHVTATVPLTPDSAGRSGAATARAREQQHVIATHFTVIEGWLELLDDDDVDPAMRRRAAHVLRARTMELRLELDALMHRLQRLD